MAQDIKHSTPIDEQLLFLASPEKVVLDYYEDTYFVNRGATLNSRHIPKLTIGVFRVEVHSRGHVQGVYRGEELGAKSITMSIETF